ncbi:hypothetical protein K504DRAFT_50371 [Pleomassaria siparia CBS 279.74]|uniref:Uncharacterized protein n=1 Tax=Pleomassaria siparia CBS 279.74 TaxID=1314801 RepID=A0A6G1K2K9_9PLEO|nr:hypothetical protein K504DRAFT_50371 [Pleomassaria siparia CBS 279.74]
MFIHRGWNVIWRALMFIVCRVIGWKCSTDMFTTARVTMSETWLSEDGTDLGKTYESDTTSGDESKSGSSVGHGGSGERRRRVSGSQGRRGSSSSSGVDGGDVSVGSAGSGSEGSDNGDDGELHFDMWVVCLVGRRVGCCSSC